MTTKISNPIKQAAYVANSVIDEIERAVVGKRLQLEMIMVSILASGGHVLLEDYPGLAKTLIANSFAAALGMSFKRIQFTPDLLPGDITGGYIYDRVKNTFQLRPGPLFANIVLADEINRASPRTQSALLEAMQEYQVSIDGETMQLPQPFIVIATENPIEYEGTFPLPEAQLDRFMMKISIGYPSLEEEQEIIHRRRERETDNIPLRAITDVNGLLEMRKAVEKVYVDSDLERYIVQLTAQTRGHRQIAVGASPRGTLAILKLARAYAAMQSREYVLPDDVKHIAVAALSHRIILEPDLWTNRKAAASIIDEIIKKTPVPVIESQ